MLPRRLPVRAATALAAGAVALGLAPAAASANATSSNWAGYVAHNTGTSYRTVTAAWTVPTVTCGSGSAYSAAWIGLGGYHTNSPALEQVGTEADCTARGNARYTAWYELVPQNSVRIAETVKAGDKVSARVTVNGRHVFVRLSDLTTGATFSKTLTATAIDTTAAEWIVEAPSECLGSTSFCRVLPLAQFSDTTFTAARAVSSTGHAGAISDPSWRATAIDLASDGRHRFGDPRNASSSNAASATTGQLAGDTFTVTYASAPSEPPTGGPPVT